MYSKDRFGFAFQMGNSYLCKKSMCTNILGYIWYYLDLSPPPIKDTDTTWSLLWELNEIIYLKWETHRSYIMHAIWLISDPLWYIDNIPKILILRILHLQLVQKLSVLHLWMILISHIKLMWWIFFYW